QTAKQAHEALVRDFEAKLALADTTVRVVEARAQEAETATMLLKQECDDKIRILTEELQRDAEMSRLRVTEEHLRKLEEVVENARVNKQHQQRALDDVQAALSNKTQRLDVASQQLTQCEGQVRDLQRNAEASESELRDAKRLIIARTSTIDSLRKELTELHEATEATPSELSVGECLARLRQQLDAHLWTRYHLDRAQVPGLVYTTEADVFECLQQFVRIRCARLKRYDEEEKEDGNDKKSETRLEAALVLSVDDVCMRVRDYDVVASTYGKLFKDDNSSALTKKVSSEIAQVLTEFTQLVQRIEALFCLHLASEENAKSRHTVSSLLLKLESYATLLVKLGLIGVEDPHARGDEILKMRKQHDAFLQHAATLWNSETMQLSSLEDIGALLTQVHDVLEFARGATKCELGECNTLANIKALVAELVYLWTAYDTYTTTQDAKSSLLEPHNVKSDGSMDSHASVAAKSAEIVRFVDNSTRFIAGCQAVLQLNPFNNEASSFAPPTCSTDEILQHIRAILRSVDNSTHFVANCRAVLRLDPPNKEASPSDSSSTNQILQCIQELMAVLDHFDAFQSLPMARINSDGVVDTSAHSSAADNGSALASIQRKVGIVRTFLDELHLMADFAQSILDEENDATASTDALGSTSTNMSNSNSNSSSHESLQGFRALTRTSTPTSVGFGGNNEDDERPTNLAIDVPDPLNELGLELQQRDDDMTSGFTSNVEFAGEDDDDLVAGTLPFKANGKAPSPSSPLADSLVDISLVMNDHHRILSEAAHWVHKTARLRGRSLSGQVQQKQQPRDLGSEICRLVREHCAVLSLAKKLFKLKDPRHDLSMLLECLAILKRLTTRLPVFRQDGSYLQDHAMPPSDSNEGLLRNSSTTSSTSSLADAAASYAGGNRNNASHQSSVSIFACIEDIARHLQDYDFFLQQMQTNREKQWLLDHSNTSSLDFVPNIEIITCDVTARLKLLATTAQSLGLQDPSIELPQLCERIQTLVARCTSLDPWKTSESTGDLHNEAQPDDTELDNEAMKTTDLTDSETTSELHVTLQSATKSYSAGLGDIERDLTAYTTFIDWLRRALPFSQSVESVDDLQLRTQSILDQLEHFANENVELREQVAAYYAEREQQKQQQEQEDAFLAAHGVSVAVAKSTALDASTNDGSSASSSRTRSRIAIFEQLLGEQQRLATKTSDIDANMSLETEYLVVHGLLPPLASDSMTLKQTIEQTGDEHENEEPRQQLSTQIRIQIYTQLLQRLEEQMTAHQHLEVAHQKLTMTLEEQKRRLEEQTAAYQNLEMTYRKLEMVVEEKQQRLEEQITVQQNLEMARRELEMALAEKQQYQDEQTTAQRKLEMVLEEQQQHDCERINAVTTSFHGMQQNLEMVLNEQQQSAYERVNAVTDSLHDLQSRLAACVSNENAFLQAHNVVLPLPPGKISGDTKDTMTLLADRIPVYEHFVAAITRLEAVQQQVRDELSAERRALEQFGLVGVSTEVEKVEVEAEATASGAETATDSKDQGVFHATAAPSTASLPVTLSTRLALYERLAQLQAQMRAQSDAVVAEKAFLGTHLLQLDAANVASSRTDVYKTLLEGQNALIDEKMEREVDLERENAFLARNGLPCGDRMALFEDMVALRHELDARDSMNAREQTFLKEHGLWMPEADKKEEESASIDTKMDAQERFDMRFRAFTELIEARAVQEQKRQHRQAAIEAEKAYLTQQRIVNLGDAADFAAPGFSRLRVFKTLVDAHEAAQAAWKTQNSHVMAHFPDHETQFLMKNGLQVSTLQNQELEGDSEENASTLRRKVYNELFCRIRMCEAQVDEVTAQRERCETLLMASNEVPLVAMNHVELLAREMEQLRSESAGREAQLDRCKQDQALAIETHATELAWLQSTHDEALATLQANHDEAFAKLQSTHDKTLARLQTTHADALASFGAQCKQELVAALAKQTKQLEFVALVRAEEESHQRQFSHTQSTGQSGVSPIQARALLLDKFAKRDTAAISMIYRSIRLATDILNTSAFVGGSSSAAGPATPMTVAHASEISVEVTQSVLNCVKELKALKEYLIESLEQLTHGDDVFPSQPPPFVKLNIANALASSASSSEDPREKNEAAIDFALCSHREFMNYAHLQLLAREEAMHSSFIKLTNSLQSIARGDEYDSNNNNSTGVEAFTVSQQKFMQLEMDAVRESETRQNVDCKLHLNETYYHRLLDERKEVEVTLNNALADLRVECKSLRAKVDTLECERYTAPPPSSAFSAGLYGLISSPSPRATPMMSVSNSSNFGFPVTPMRPEKPRDGGVSKPGGSIHKERFVSDLEKETGQRRSEAAHNATSTRRIHEWKKQDELLQLSSSTHLEHEFRAMQAATTTASSLVPVAEASTPFKRGGSTANGPRSGVGPNPHDQELWYQGVRSVHYISFFVSMFHVPKQNLFRVEVFNSETEQQQTIYVTWSELEAFLSESKKARNLGLSLHDVIKRSEIADVLFERVRVYGEGTPNILLGFE
uniref:Uncharacterized protein n=1 Tax=Globisporangium ultimum (strain ATCC 200006 / CBS 805.95 / DAOM BR144) TaxID=431595 RepID=K3WYC2_GLOUD